jgi:threonine dehydrogenase-like Zn-dependent dehydrogenase
MKGTILHGPRDIRLEERDAPKIVHPTDAIIRIAATRVCGSDLWPYRGITRSPNPCRWDMNIAESSRRSVRR